GVMVLNAVNADTEFRLANGTVLAGGGIINMGTNVNGLIRGVSFGGTEVPINLDNTIQGAGRLGVNAMGLDNRGTINANQPIPLQIDPTDGIGFKNSGTDRKSTRRNLSH